MSKYVLLFTALICLVLLAGVAVAGDQMVYPNKTVTFDNSFWLGGQLLPAGEYHIRHVMEGDQHVMYFRNVNQRKAEEVRVICTVTPLQAKASISEQYFNRNDKGELVLQALVFKGDTIKHVF